MPIFTETLRSVNMNAATVLDFFKEITRIPRESGHEGPMTAYLQDFAKARSLECRTDRTGNVVIVKEAAPGKENVPILVLQAHQDMVCEKHAHFDFDFLTQPIPYEIEDGWMVAKNTTLGADDGIGIAACLALLDSNLPTGKLECLFTISEETGMDGAFALEPGFFDGKVLINLDSEDEGQLFVGCAGGVNTMATFHYTCEPVEKNKKLLKIRLFNAVGGHSGDDINKERGNMVQQLARFLYTQRGSAMQLVSIHGGGKHNAIAREAEAIVAVPDPDAFTQAFQQFGEALRKEFATSDPDIRYSISDAKACEQAIDADSARRLVAALVAVHHGVLAMSQDIPGLVETSNNLASVKMTAPGVIEVCTSQRSSSESAKQFIADKIEACFVLAGADVRRSDPYPGWKPDMSSKILKDTVESYRRLFGKDPEVKAIHAGLECGLFLEKFPDLDMISFGPTLRGVHAPGEKLELASNEKFTALLADVVTHFS